MVTSRLLGRLALVWFFAHSSLALSVQPKLDKELTRAIEKVCGFCHFYEYFDEESGNLIEAKFFAKQQEILRRLVLGPRDKERMPPSHSPFGLDEDTRLRLIEVLEFIED